MRINIFILGCLFILLSGCNKVDYTPIASPANSVTLNATGVKIFEKAIAKNIITVGLSEAEDIYVVILTFHNQSDIPVTLNLTDFHMQEGKQVITKPLDPQIVLTHYKEKIAQASKQSEYYANKKTKTEREAIFVTDNIYTPQSTDSAILEGYNTGLVTQYNKDIAFLNTHSLTNALISSGEKKEKVVYFSKLPTDTLPITIYYKEMPFTFTKE